MPNEADPLQGIAIVGMAGRFPGSADVREFWRNLRDGTESIRFFTREELRANGVPAYAIDDPDYVPANGYLDGVEMFDAAFFGIPPREAEIMDPQHRLLLECAWEVLEDAGYVPGEFKGKIGAFAGTGASSYLIRNLLANPALLKEVGELGLLMGNSKDFAVTRLCYKLDLRGPGVSVNTACSSGLVAVHFACQSLLDYQCDLAIAGGAGVQVPQDSGYLYHPSGISSSDGHCRVFDARAGGTVHGNGVALVALRRLQDAIDTGDHIHAVILGSAINNDGADKVGYTAPGVTGQASVIAEALAMADCDPETVSYVETHGTGTRLGDPVEIAALRRAFGRAARRQHCAIGSVKSNIGHLDEAAGAAGLIKAALALENRQIPPSLHFEEPNPEIDFKDSPFFVNTKLRDWDESRDWPRRAGVSSFGIGGTNAHAVLEEAPELPKPGGSRPWQVLTVSARSSTALEEASKRLAGRLEEDRSISLADAAFTLHTGRRAFEHRTAIVCRDIHDAVGALRGQQSGNALSGTAAKAPHIGFVFSGQGSQYAGMGREFYDSEPVFRDAFDQCADILKEHLGQDIRRIVYPATLNAESDATLRQTGLAQPCLFAFEYAVAKLWMSFGVKPAYMAGHSAGEYVAAHFAGVISLEDALSLLVERGHLIQQLPGGSMLAVAMDETELMPMLNGSLSVAVRNSPGLTVVAGEEAAVAALENRLAHTHVSAQRLQTSHAFHSPMMDAAIEPFRTRVARRSLATPRIPFVSNVTGDWITGGEATDPAYWSRHLRQPVNFAGCLDRLAEMPGLILLEIGPGEALKTIALRHPAWHGRRVLHSVRHPKSTESDHGVLARAIGQLWADGVPVDWAGFHAHEKRRRVSLPGYPFERQRYWIDAPRGEAEKEKAPAPDIDDWFYTPEWQAAAAPNPRGRAAASLTFSAEASFTQVLTTCAGPAVRIIYRAEHGISSLLLLAQTLGRSGYDDIELIIVTTELYSVNGSENLQPDQALVAGAAQTIPLEYSARCRFIDIDRTCDTDALLREIESDSADGHVALRGGKRFTRRFVQTAIGGPGLPGVLRPRGVYLITGGFGSMGLAFARFLAAEVQARVVLVGRTGLPPRRTWQTLIDAGPAAPGAAEFASLTEIARGRKAGFSSPHPEWRRTLNVLCAAFVADYVRGAASLAAGSCEELENLRDRLGVKPAYFRFFDGLIAILTADGYAREVAGSLEMLKPVPRAAQMLEQARGSHPEMRGAIRLLERCAGYYSHVLSGQSPGIEALYPDGTPEFLNACAAETVSYTSAPHYLKAAAQVVRAYAGARDAVSILEVGGGNGDLTGELAAVLDPSRVSYRFTDISPAFVAQAERLAQQRGYTWMQFGLLDIARDPSIQGFASQSFDVIAAYNVIHVAPDIRAALSNLRKLLKPGGLIVLGETRFLHRWDFMSWGLAEDLWRFEDGDWRGDSPFIPIEQWKAALRETGFEQVAGFPEGNDEPEHDSGLVFAVTAESGSDELTLRYSRTRKAIERVVEIERLGGETLLCRADVSDAAQMQAVCDQAREKFGFINGVIHTAGSLGQQLIRTSTPESVEAILRPKVEAIKSIVKNLASGAPDFMILCSSYGAIAPIAGQFGYAAANSWLDAFAHYASRESGWRTVSINWNFWQELGMIEHARSSVEEKRAIQDEIRERGWSEAGVAAFSRILKSFAGVQVVVSPHSVASAPALRIGHSLIQNKAEIPAPFQAYSAMLSPASHWEIGDHRPGGVPLLPGTAYLEIALTAFQLATNNSAAELRDVFFVAPMLFGDAGTREMRAILKPVDDGYRFFVVSRRNGDRDAWTEHAHGEIGPSKTGTVPRIAQTQPADLYPEHPLAIRQQTFSPRWRCLRRISSNKDGLIAHLSLPPEWTDEAASYRLHPALLDIAVGVSAMCQGFEEGLPFSYGSLRVYGNLPASCVISSRYYGDRSGDTFTIDLTIADEEGNVCAEIENYAMRRIRELPARAQTRQAGNWELVQSSTGSLGSVGFRDRERTAPLAHQVEIEVHAAGLNFIEVLFALGMLPHFEGATPARFGLECSGVVARVGSAVTGLQPGDEVMAFSESSFSRFTLAEARAVAIKPARLSMQAAATIPAAFCTAWYALVTKAGLRPRERVLIHSAAGGVGLAAVQIAQWIGAEIFATAGSDEKRDRLRALGVPHVMSSRTVEFADEIARITERRGVDVILNSLNGDYLSRSLDCMAAYGRFLEVGKRDFASGRLLDLSPFLKRLSFFAIDVGTDLPDFETLWGEVVSHVKEGHIGPLPFTAFPIAEATRAFDYMAQAKHFGKIVISMPDATAPGRAARTLAAIIGAVTESDIAPQAAEAPAVARHARPTLSKPFREPSQGTETMIAKIWEELLGIAPVGADDNFFELRGDSLLAAQVFSRIYKTVQVRLPLNAVFEAPTPGELARRVDRLAGVTLAMSAPADRATESEEEGEL